MSEHTNTTPTDSDEPAVTVRTHTELADALPYLLGFQPDESLVLVAVHGSRGRFGGRVTVGIPADPADWAVVADAVTDALVTGSTRRQGLPEGIVAFLCREPGPGEDGTTVMECLRPLAQHVRLAAGARDVPVVDALCLSDHRCWSYCCPDPACCPPEGNAQKAPGTSAVAAAAAYAGMTVRGSLRAMQRRLLPPDDGGDPRWTTALDTACANLLPRLVDEREAAEVADLTLTTTADLLTRLHRLPQVRDLKAADACDDRAIGIEEAVASRLVAPARAARAVSTMFLGLTVANIVGVPAGTALGQQFGWRSAYLAVAVIGLIALAALARLVPHQPRAEGAGIRHELRAMGNRHIAIGLATAVVGFGGCFAVYSYLVPMLTEVTGMASSSTTLVLALYGVGMTLGTLLAGPMTDRALRPTLYGGLAVMAVVLFAFYFAVQHTVTALVCVLLIGAMGSFITTPVQMLLMAKAEQAPTMAAASNHSAFNLANAGGAWLGGLVISAGWGWASPALVGASLAAVGLGPLSLIHT
ncbi:MFS transporter [Streptomyces albidoflavus]|uniref:MFS transporter n=1 Tax=Streptomyces albidoflavus TaxID=1886 RepID=UPI00267EDA29